MLFKIVFILGSLVFMTNAACNLTAAPLDLIDCLTHVTTILIGVGRNGEYMNNF
jgi:hypothetical protein